MRKKRPEVYSVGHCPVCGPQDSVLALKRADSMDLAFHCPLCGCAWPAPPDPTRLDEVQGLVELAPNGVVPADLSEISGMGIVTTVLASDWLEFVDLVEPEQELRAADLD